LFLLSPEGDAMPLEPAPDPYSTSIGQAIVDALAYSDVFDYPLTSGQIWRYLVRTPASQEQVEQALASDPWLSDRIESNGELYCLAGRSATFAVRAARADDSAWLWRRARVLARVVAVLPFARMVAIIGSLTMDNARSRSDDIDLFIVTAPGRVWLTRAFVIVLVRLARLAKIDLCPNYILSERKLRMASQDLFTARELAQMRPLHGQRAFGDLLAANDWLCFTLPNAAPRTESLTDLSSAAQLAQRALEWPLRGRPGDRLEARLRRRKVTELAQEAAATGSREVVLEPEVCKGHMDSHGKKIRQEYSRRRERYLAPEPVWKE
jgi:hypothetical protein